MTEREQRPLVRSFQWSAGGAVMVRLVVGARSLALARIAGPENLGILAAVVAFTSAAALISDLGVRSYVIHLGPDAKGETSAAYRVAFSAGVAATIALVAIAPVLSHIYHDHRVVPVALAMAVTVLVPAMVAVPSALMRLEFRFRDLAVAQLGGELVATVVGLSLALSGRGLAGLVAASVASQVVGAVLLLFLYRRSRLNESESGRTDVGPRRRGWRPAAVYGATVSAGGLLWLLALQGDNVAIGHLLGPRSLGLYAFAFSYGTMPGALVGAIVGDVGAPSMAFEPDRRLVLYRELTTLSALLLAPITATGFVFAGPAVRTVLGPDWIEAIRPLQVMLVLGFVRAVFPTPTLLRALGRVRVEPALGLLGGPLTVIAAVFLARHSLAATAMGVTAVAILGELAAAFIASEGDPRLRRAVLSSPLPPAALGAVAAAIVLVIASAAHASDLAQVVVGAPLSLGLGLAAALSSPGRRSLARTHMVGSQSG